MCGIAGYFRSDQAEPNAGRLLRMLRAVRRRGPDDEGLLMVEAASGRARAFATDETAAGAADLTPLDPAASFPHRIGLGQRRFSIIDLSPGGHQPFHVPEADVWLVFNGEIYNYVEVRAELETRGHAFRSESDTEVLLRAFLEWGEAGFDRLNGFWAVALYDGRRGGLLLARDRIGKAPLYFTRNAAGLFFCSEIKGLHAALGVESFRINEQSVDDFVRNNRRDLFDSTFFQDISTFPAASFAWVNPDGSFAPTRYWSVPEHRLNDGDIGVAQAADEFRRLLIDSVRIRLRADVPVGLDLSGGLDSSSIVASAVAVRQSQRLRVFTVSYPSSAYDELPFAQQVVRRYADSVEHIVLTPSGDDLLDRLDDFVRLMDEPFHDPQTLDHHGIWRTMSGMGLRVSLNGAAGDELLAGYGSEYFGLYLHELLRTGHTGRFIREFLTYSEHDPGGYGIDYLRRAYRLLPQSWRPYHNPAMDVAPDRDPYRPGPRSSSRPGPAADVRRRLIDCMTQWRMNYWCRLGNQNSMGVPLEFRCPFLDYRLVEFAFRLPLSFLIRDGWLKWILRKASEPLLPRGIIWRKQKGGFRYPLAERLPGLREPLLGMLRGSECPYVDEARLASSYDDLARRNPLYLWRVLSVALWWKRCVRQEPLRVETPPSGQSARRTRGAVLTAETA